MSRRLLLAASPLALALLVYAALALPLRARAASLQDDFGRARRERLQAQAQLAPLLRQEVVRREAQAAFSEAVAREGGAEAAVRRSVLAALDQSGASSVRLGVRPSPGGPTVRLRASAPYPEGLRLAGTLARARTGLVLKRVGIEPAKNDRGQVDLEVEAKAFHVAP